MFHDIMSWKLPAFSWAFPLKLENILMAIQSTSNLQSAIDTFRVAEAGRFRQTLDQGGALQKAASVGDVKGKLVAWVLASPGREGTLAGRGVKALVNLFGKDNFESVSNALQNSRETSVRNLFDAILRQGESQLDKDFSKQFSTTAMKRLQEKGMKNFSVRDFTGLQQTMKDLVVKLNQSRQEAITTAKQKAITDVQGGQPTYSMKALGPADLKFAAEVMLSANVGGHRQISKFPEDVNKDKFNAVNQELDTMSRQLREHLNRTLLISDDTVDSLKKEGRVDDDSLLKQARAEVQKHVSNFRESYISTMNSLAQEQAAPRTAATETAPRTAATDKPSAAITGKEKLQQEHDSLIFKYDAAQTNFEYNNRTYMEVKKIANENRGEDGKLTLREQEKVDFYRKLAVDAKDKVIQLRGQLATLKRRLAS